MREWRLGGSPGAGSAHGVGVVVELQCSGCGRLVGELSGDARNGLVQISGADTRGGIRYIRPQRVSHDRRAPAEDRIQFYCDDRCGIRYSLPHAELDALIRQGGRGAAPSRYRVGLPVRGSRNGRSPRLARRRASRDNSQQNRSRHNRSQQVDG